MERIPHFVPRTLTTNTGFRYGDSCSVQHLSRLQGINYSTGWLTPLQNPKESYQPYDMNIISTSQSYVLFQHRGGDTLRVAGVVHSSKARRY